MKVVLALYFAFNILALVNERAEWGSSISIPRATFFKTLLFGVPLYALAFVKDLLPKKKG